MPKQFNKRTFAAKIESTYGTAETLTSSECLRVNEISMKYASELIKRMKSTGNLGTDTSPASARHIEMKIQNFLHGDGTSGDPAWASVLFPSVGMPSPSSNTYTTSSVTSDWRGITAAKNTDGRRLLGRGGMGNLKMTLTSGQPVLCDWDYILGVGAGSTVNKYTDATQLTGMSFESVNPPIFQAGSAVSVHSLALKISKATIDLGNNPFPRPDPTKEGGFIGGWLTDIVPVITLDPEAETVATKDWIPAFTGANEASIVFVIGSVAGNTATITATNTQLLNPPEEAQRNNLLLDNLSFQVNGSLSIAFS